MAATNSVSDLPKLMEGLTLAVDKKSDEVADILDKIIKQVQNSENDFASTSCTDVLAELLQWDSAEVKAKTAKVIAEVSKGDAGREKCAVPVLVRLLVGILVQSQQDLSVVTQSCRALGNICYENDSGRSLVLDEGGLPVLVSALERSVQEADEEGRALRCAAAGLLLNVLAGQEEAQQQVVALGALGRLAQVLQMDGCSPEGEDATTHALLILGLLADSAGSGDSVLDDQLCEVAVKVLGSTTSPEVSEMCLELLYGQAEDENVKVRLAKAGLCELLVKLLNKHKPLADDDESRNLMKMACDLIVLVLTGDASMNILYAKGQGQVFREMVDWLGSDDEDLQITGVLAMGNFARTDRHCIQMVEAGVSHKLLSLLKKNNTPDGDIRLQHALLSALRNLVIPSQNKASVLGDGLVDAVYPMLAIPTFPVVFKLLGTLRMLVDGQESAARQLGSKEELVQRLVEWCGTEDHPGVQGEANRLLAWLIKNSRDQEVLTTIIKGGAVPHLVKMVVAEHAVMQNEALLALSLLSTMRLDDVEGILIESNIGTNITKLLNDFGAALQPEVIKNVVTLTEYLQKSGAVRKHLVESRVSSALTKIAAFEKVMEMKSQITNLAHLLDSG